MQWNTAPEYISLLFISILIVYSKEYTLIPTLKNKLFRMCLYFAFFEIIISIVSIIAIENYRTIPGIANQIIQTLYFLAAPSLAVIFMAYLIAVVREDDPKICKYFGINAIPYALYAVLVLINPVTSMLYSISESDGFTFKDGFFLIYSIPLLYTLVMIFIILFNQKRLKRHLQIILLSFPTITLIMLGIQWIDPTLILSGSAATSALMILYLYLQNNVIRDIAEQKKIKKQLEHYLKDLLESQRLAHIGTWRLDLETNQVVWSDELYKMYGFDPLFPPPPLTEHMKLFTPESWEKLSTSIEHTRTSGIPYEVELETLKSDGSNGWMWARGEAERDSKNSIISLWGVAQDITERKKTEYDLIYYACHDQLTGLYNRRFYEDALKRLDTITNLPLTLVFGDINGLKHINDTLGHTMGDKVLMKTAEVLKKGCRSDDILARLGGDEFVFILPKTDSSVAEQIINRINKLYLEEKVGGI
ncbi:MAG: diguanylate cyclase, partial [Eubacteriales bacterium]